MTAAQKIDLISVEDYLAGELVSLIKHEYVDGRVYERGDMPGRHNEVATNFLACVGLRGGNLRPRAICSGTR